VSPGVGNSNDGRDNLNGFLTAPRSRARHFAMPLGPRSVPCGYPVAPSSQYSPSSLTSPRIQRPQRSPILSAIPGERRSPILSAVSGQNRWRGRRGRGGEPEQAGAGRGRTFAVQVYSFPRREFLQIIAGRSEPDWEYSLLSETTARAMELRIHTLPPQRRLYCPGPGGFVRPIGFVMVGMRVIGPSSIGIETALRVFSWQNGPDVYLGRRLRDFGLTVGPDMWSSCSNSDLARGPTGMRLSVSSVRITSI
jgi:hypothetical protein